MSFKEKDIRDPNILSKYLELVEEDSKAILETQNSLELIDQKVWGLGESESAFKKSGYNYERCVKTGTLFVNPRPKFQYLSKFYSSSKSSSYWVNDFFLPKVENRRKRIFKPRAKFVFERFENINKIRIGDIGAGFGLFIEEMNSLSDFNLNIEAIEPSVDMANICREKGIIVNQSMLENLFGKVKRYDLLTTYELFEHLHDPLTFLKHCFKMLNPGGNILLSTLSSYGFDIQTLWERSNSVFPPHHLNFFNPTSIKNILKIAGFRNVEITTPGELDVDIVLNSYKSGESKIPRFFKTIFDLKSESPLINFQTFLKENNLSSHMLVIAQKPK